MAITIKTVHTPFNDWESVEGGNSRSVHVIDWIPKKVGQRTTVNQHLWVLVAEQVEKNTMPRNLQRSSSAWVVASHNDKGKYPEEK